MKTTTIYKVLGSTEDVTSCDCCGRQDLKKTVIMGLLDCDGNVETEQHFGVVCAARHSGMQAKDIRKDAKAADNRFKLLAAQKIIAEVDAMTVPQHFLEYYDNTSENKVGLRVTIGDCSEDVWQMAYETDGPEGAIRRVTKSWKKARRMELGTKFGFGSAYEIWECSKGLR